MSVFRKSGSYATNKPKFAGVIIDASSDTNRFLAMKELFDIAKHKAHDPSYTPADSEFTYATKGAVCFLPDMPAMYENYTLDVIYSKNAAVQTIPASTTKMWTAAVALQYVSIKEKYTITSDDVQSGSGNYFSAGDVLTVEDILYGMFLPSSNTCASALAHMVGELILGDQSATYAACQAAFIVEMNAKAANIGCTGTVFDSASGLSTTNKTTAADLLRMLIESSSYEDIQRIWNKKAYSIAVGGSNARTVDVTTTVTNETLEADYYIFGGKTGHLDGYADALVMIAEEV